LLVVRGHFRSRREPAPFRIGFLYAGSGMTVQSVTLRLPEELDAALPRSRREKAELLPFIGCHPGVRAFDLLKRVSPSPDLFRVAVGYLVK
jgi:hypothetical protein